MNIRNSVGIGKLGMVFVVILFMFSCKYFSNEEGPMDQASRLQAVHDDTYSLIFQHSGDEDSGYRFVSCLGSLEDLDTSSCVTALNMPDGKPLDYRFMASDNIPLQDLQTIDRIKRELAASYMLSEGGESLENVSFMTAGAVVGAGSGAVAGVARVSELLRGEKTLDAKLLFAQLHKNQRISDGEMTNLLKEFNTPENLQKLKDQAGKRWREFSQGAVLRANDGGDARAIVKEIDSFYDLYIYKQGAEIGEHLKAEVTSVRAKVAPANTSSTALAVVVDGAEGSQQKPVAHSAKVSKDSARYKAAATQAKEVKELFKQGEFKQAQELRYQLDDHWILDATDQVNHQRDVVPYMGSHVTLKKRFEALYKQGQKMLDEGEDMSRFLAGSIEDVHMDLMNIPSAEEAMPFGQREAMLNGLRKQADAKGLLSVKNPKVLRAGGGVLAKSKKAPIKAAAQGTVLSKNKKVISVKPGRLGGKVMPFLGWTLSVLAGGVVIIAVVDHSKLKKFFDLKSLYLSSLGESSESSFEDAEDIYQGSSPEDVSKAVVTDMATSVPFVPVSIYGSYFPALQSLDPKMSLEVPSVVSVLKTLAVHASYGDVELASEMRICLPANASAEPLCKSVSSL